MKEFGDSADEPFFRERAERKRPGAERNLFRAASFAHALGVPTGDDPRRIPAIIVVGSKGKGTAATFASSLLRTQGLRVGTLTSPGYRSHRERIRVNGKAITRQEYVRLSSLIGSTLSQAALPDLGYLSPTGLYTLAGMRHFVDRKCDVVVMEAGMGGRHDEVSLFVGDVVVAVAIFGEHLGILGDSIAEIAEEKLGVVGAHTRAVVTVAGQSGDALPAIRKAASRRKLVVAARDRESLPPDLIGVNASAGIQAAGALLETLRKPPPSDAAIERAIAGVRLPGRRSVHPFNKGILALDCAINQSGISAALGWMEGAYGRPSSVLLCLPDGKDRTGVTELLAGYPVVPCRSDASHLRFTSWEGTLPSFSELTHGTLGDSVLALGTISFAGDILDALGVDCERNYAV